jgi:integrase
MQQLPNGCRRSEYSVWPKNWKTVRASLIKDWYVTYRYYDPSQAERYPKGKLVMVKGMNGYKDLRGRQQATEKILCMLDALLEQKGYNPITEASIPPSEARDVDGTTSFLPAIDAAYKAMDHSKSMMRDIRSTIRATKKAAAAKSMRFVPIDAVKRSHIFLILNHIEDTAKEKSNHRFNKHRTDLKMVFDQLIEMGAIENNPVLGIKKRKVVKKKAEVLTDDERKKVAKHLSVNHPRLWNFCNIFFHSGARLTEMMQVKYEDVDLTRQVFSTVVMKRKQPIEVERVIKTVAIDYWKEAMKDAAPGQYLFSYGLKPGVKQMNTDRITKRWKQAVKVKLKINKDFYKLKHLNTTEVSDILGEQAAADLNQHTDTAMVIEIYDVNNKKRKDEQLKRLSNTL